MKKRVITGIVLLAVMIPVILIGSWIFHLMMMFFVIVGCFELYSMFSKRKEFQLPQKVICTILALAAYAVLAFSWSLQNSEGVDRLQMTNVAFGGYLVTLLISLLVIFSMLVFYDDFDGEDVGKCLLVINYVALGCGSMAILRDMGVRFLIYMFIVTFSTDAFAYFVGVLFGKHKMSPKISPKKSWEGAIGGTICATALGTVFAFFYGTLFNNDFLNSDHNVTLLDRFCSIGAEQNTLQLVLIIFITFFASIVGQIGDLVASKLKRSYDIKDFGNIFPGHGGVLDRFDSSIFVGMFLMATFIILRLIFPL